MWQRWISEFVSSSLSMHSGSGISHGAAPTTNALNLRFFHNFVFRNSSFAVSLVANWRTSDANETKTFTSWLLKTNKWKSIFYNSVCVTKSNRPSSVSIVALLSRFFILSEHVSLIITYAALAMLSESGDRLRSALMFKSIDEKPRLNNWVGVNCSEIGLNREK